ncbi:MAG: FAD-dependent oxidoreductase [Fimbriimonadaceae bacterium]|nr:FAD-dependent oxidoreductase [Fimbriimonadaceae bacterium]
MKVAVVGAGIAGIACARLLHQAGVETVIFEKSKGFSGRAATRRVGPYTFDTGATSITPRGRALETVMMSEISTQGLIRIERPIYTHVYGRIEPGDPMKNRIPRYVYESGINQIGKRLATGLDIRLETEISAMELPRDGGVFVHDQVFDRAVLAVPLPQAQTLLQSAKDPRLLTASVYRPCLSILLGFAVPFDAPYHAILDPDQLHPLTWLSVETLKSPGRAPAGHTALVAQMGPAYSRRNDKTEDDRIIKDVLVDIQRLLGDEFVEPEVAEVKRWKYSQPESTISFAALNAPGRPIIVSGDGTTGGRIEHAYEAGMAAAQSILQT